MSNIWKIVILSIIAYLLGNITFARIFARVNRKDDITTHGSGNPGTMNMLRTHGVTLAVATLIFDALKAVISCLLAYFWLRNTASDYAVKLGIYIVGLCCVIGHNYPVIFKFKGGKGIATSFGFSCVAQPILIPVILAVFLTIFLIWKVASLASLSAVFVFVIIDSIMLLIKGYYACFVVLMLFLVLLVYAHRKNIDKLFKNNENKFDLKETIKKDKDYVKAKKEKRLQKKQDKQNKKLALAKNETAEEIAKDDSAEVEGAEKSKENEKAEQ